MNAVLAPPFPVPFALIADSVASARTLEDLVRPLLEVLEAFTGMESTYLTAVDEDAGVQHVLYARNTRQLQIPERLVVPWNDTLCKRALDEGRAYTDDVPACWGDSDAARQLGIQTYVSTPVRLEDGTLYGTLCAASARSLPLGDDAERALRFRKPSGEGIEPLALRLLGKGYRHQIRDRPRTLRREVRHVDRQRLPGDVGRRVVGEEVHPLGDGIRRQNQVLVRRRRENGAVVLETQRAGETRGKRREGGLDQLVLAHGAPPPCMATSKIRHSRQVSVASAERETSAKLLSRQIFRAFDASSAGFQVSLTYVRTHAEHGFAMTPGMTNRAR